MVNFNLPHQFSEKSPEEALESVSKNLDKERGKMNKQQKVLENNLNNEPQKTFDIY